MNADKRGWTQWSPQDFSAGQTGLVILQVGQILREPGFRKFHRLGKLGPQLPAGIVLSHQCDCSGLQLSMIEFIQSKASRPNLQGNRPTLPDLQLRKTPITLGTPEPMH